MTSEKVCVLGTGRMGSALARALCRAGHATTVWNRTHERALPLADAGAHVEAKLERAIAAADVLVLNLDSYETTEQLLSPAPVVQLLRGRTLIQLASGSPGLARRAGEWAQAHNVQYLDGAIMCTPDFIGAAGALLLYGGASALFERWRPMLQAFSERPTYVGSDLGHPSVLDSGLLAAMWGSLFGMLLGVGVCEAEGISAANYQTHLATVQPMLRSAMDDVIGRVVHRRYRADEATLANLNVHYIAFRHLRELSERHEVHANVSQGFEAVFKAAIQRGWQDHDFAALHQLALRSVGAASSQTVAAT